MRNLWAVGAVAVALAIAVAGCPASEKSDGGGPLAVGATCVKGKAIACMCPDGHLSMTTCVSDRRTGACPCFGNSDPSTALANDSLKKPMMDVPEMMVPDPPPMSGVAGTAPMPGTGGAPDPMTSGSGGMSTMGSGGTPATAGTGGGGGGMPTGTDEVMALRQICVDTINMYRATVAVTPALAPLVRGTPDDETCSDNGAKIDGDSGQAHKSAGMCMGYGGQDACPGWPVGGNTQFGGFATLEEALKSCLQQMWDEGEPPVSRAECQKDYQGCFLKYGHYLNMSDPGYTGVVCGFYLMSDGKSWWMNQDFKQKPWGAP